MQNPSIKEVSIYECKRNFIEQILKKSFPKDYNIIYDNSYLIQYLDIKMGAIHGDSKKRRSLGNIYSIYAILNFYKNDFFNKPDLYRNFEGYQFTKVLSFCKNLYGGVKLQNHPLNNRINFEFSNKFPQLENDLIIKNNGKYLIHIDYLYVNEKDVAKVACGIIEKYINLLIEKDSELLKILDRLKSSKSIKEKKSNIELLLDENAEARIFEIISYAILKTHYKNIEVYFGYSKTDIRQHKLKLYKTGRTNANDGGIDFVMRPVGRFFQVTEVSNYDKYLLDIDKVEHFPITFVVKTYKEKGLILKELLDYIANRSSGMKVIEDRYTKAIEEIITINELKQWINELNNSDINEIIDDINIYYKLEMNIDDM